MAKKPGQTSGGIPNTLPNTYPELLAHKNAILADGKTPSGHIYTKLRRLKREYEEETKNQALKSQGKLIDVQKGELGEWIPRFHQRQLNEAYANGYLRQAHVWHRRAGKTAAMLDFMARRAMERPGNYWFMTPKTVQTRVAVWESRRADGIKEIDVHIPEQIRTKTLENQMSIDLTNGSQIRFLGSDGFDRLVGSNVHGLVFDEFALGDPAAWDYLAPILAADPESWACFISTYRGRNHWYRMVQRVKDDSRWHTSFLTVDDTFKEDGKTPIVSHEAIENERNEGKSEEYIRQEYYNDPLAAFDGAYYAGAMRAMQTAGRIGPCGYQSDLPVVSAWDLGYADELVVTFWQTYGNEERCIGSRSWKFTALPDAIDDIKRTYPWGNRPMVAVLPHDGRFGTAELFERYGYQPVVLPRTQNVHGEIERVRNFLSRVWIDSDVRVYSDNDENNARLTEALLGYRTQKTAGADVYQKKPAHSWESHWCDSVRYYVVYREEHSVTESWGPAPDYTNQDRIARTII